MTPSRPAFDDAVALFEGGDEEMRRVVLGAAWYLGLAIAGLVGALNVRRIMLSGSMARFGRPWLAAVRRSMRLNGLTSLVESTELEIGAVDDVVVLGASALLMTRELGLTLRHR